MLATQFKKETFKQSVEENVRKLYRKTIDNATEQEVYQAVCYAVKDVIMDNWLKTQNTMNEEDPKMVYYMSMEFLMGRALGNNLINLTAYKEVKEALEEMGFDLNVLENQERDLPWATAVSAGWLPVSWILWRRSGIRLTAAESVIVTVCSSRRSTTRDVRSRCRITG